MPSTSPINNRVTPNNPFEVEVERPMVSNGSLIHHPLESATLALNQIELAVSQMSDSLVQKGLVDLLINPFTNKIQREGFECFLMSPETLTKSLSNAKPTMFLRSIDKTSAQFKISLKDEELKRAKDLCGSLRGKQGPNKNDLHYVEDSGIVRYRFRSLLPFDEVYFKVTNNTLVVDVDFNPTKALMKVLGHGDEFVNVYKSPKLTGTNKTKSNNYHPHLLPGLTFEVGMHLQISNIISYFYLNLLQEIGNLVKFIEIKITDSTCKVHIDRIEFFEDWICGEEFADFGKAKIWAYNTSIGWSDRRVDRVSLDSSLTLYSGNKKKQPEEKYIAVCCHPKEGSPRQFSSILRVERRRFMGRQSYAAVEPLVFPDLTKTASFFDAEDFYKTLVRSHFKGILTINDIRLLFANKKVKVFQKKIGSFKVQYNQSPIDKLLYYEERNQKSTGKKGGVTKYIQLSLSPKFRHYISNLD